MQKSKPLITSIIEQIGNTPLLFLKNISRKLDGNIVAKLELLNPGWSKKDRVALHIMEEAEKRGLLQKCQHVIELTSGNLGTGLAMVCRSKGYPFTAVMSKGNSKERAVMMRAFGARVILVDQAPNGIEGKVSGDDLELVEQRTRELTEELQAFRVDQFVNEFNPGSHYLGTAKEILQQSDMPIYGFCDFVGSGGTFQGCASAFKAYDPNIQCHIIEPINASVLGGKMSTTGSHLIQGGGYAINDLPVLDKDLPDGFLQVTDEEVIHCMKMLALEEGVFAGPSSGANLAGAIQLLNGPMQGKTIVIIICDSGLKYVQSGLWT